MKRWSASSAGKARPALERRIGGPKHKRPQDNRSLFKGAGISETGHQRHQEISRRLERPRQFSLAAEYFV